MKTIIERFNAPTPSFFKKLRNYALVAAAAAGALLAAPVTLPAALATACGYLVAAGAVAASVGQLAKTDAPQPAPLPRGYSYTENELPSAGAVRRSGKNMSVVR